MGLLRRGFFRALRETNIARPNRVRVNSLERFHGLIEPLEERRLLTGSATPSGFTPSQIAHAYGFDGVATFDNLAHLVRGDGSGQTIAIVGAFHTPAIQSNLHSFDLAFGLADPPTFTQVAQDGSANFPPTDPAGAGNSSWASEAALDVEWAHALAPGAKILLVEADDASYSNLLSAVDFARNAAGVSVVVMPFGVNEFAGEVGDDGQFTTPFLHTGVTFVSPSGNSGSPGKYPGYSPNVLAVGGTRLTLDGSNNYVSETGWNAGSGVASGGGISQFEPKPAYQNAIVTQSATQRTIPDVSFDADASSGVPVFDTFNNDVATPWSTLGGTGFASVAWGSLIAIANQWRGLAGLSSLDGPGETLPKIYALPASYFHDITSGNNGAFSAELGYDLVTGRGTPKVNLIVPALVGQSVATINGDLDFAGQDDTIRIVRNAANPLLVDFFVNGVLTQTSPILSMQQINVNGLGGNDTLIVDSSNGLISVPNGIHFDGGLGVDQLNLTQTGGGAQTSDTLAPGATAGAGRSTITGPTGTQQVDFQNLEPVVDVVPAAVFNIASVAGLASLLQAENAITYTAGQILLGGGRVTIDNFEPIEFLNKTNLTIDAGAGRDDVELNNTAPITGLSSLTVLGGDGDDRIIAVPGVEEFLALTLDGGIGNDFLFGDAIIIGGAGDDTLVGGAGDDQLFGGAGNDTLIASPGDDFYNGGAGFDTIVDRGTPGNDTMSVFQLIPSANLADNYQLQRSFAFNAFTLSIAKTIAASPNDSSNRPTVEEYRLEGLAGNDVFRVGHADAYSDSDSANGVPSQMLRISVDGGAPNASDRLFVSDDGTGDLVLVRQSAIPNSGRVTVAPAVNNQLGDIVYNDVERVDISPINPITGGTGTDGGGRVVVFQSDPFEMNDNRFISTELSDLSTTNLNPTIDPGGIPDAGEFPGEIGDEDWYSFDAPKTSTFQFLVHFQTIASVISGRPGLPGNGDLDIAVYSADGTLIGNGTTVFAVGDQVTFDAAKGQRVYLRVKGAPLGQFNNAINTYTVSLNDLDTLGPQVTGVFITGHKEYNLFDPKASLPAPPTPLVNELSITLQDLPVRAGGFPYPALVGGTVTEVESDDTIDTARNFDQFFNLAADPNIGNQTQNTSTSIPHATILGSGDGTFDYYSFTVGSAGLKGIFDIDGATNGGAQVDTEIFLFDSAGNFLDGNDDANASFGAGGSTSNSESYLEHTFAAAGTYIIAVGRFNSSGGPGGVTGNALLAGTTYTLHVSIPSHAVLLSPAMFEVRGDSTGIAAIQQVQFLPDPVVAGLPASGTIRLQFVASLPDDRFTLTVFDSLSDPAGNKLDGESNASQPIGTPTFPSGNGIAGGNFVARFTVDSRPEIAFYSNLTVTADINGNGFFDPANADATNRDLVFQFGDINDQRFAGKFARTLPGFDVLAAYGRTNGGAYRFLIDRNGNGRVDAGEEIASPQQLSALAVAGNFDGDPNNQDEIALFDGTTLYVLNNSLTGVFNIVTPGIHGFPVAGDFNGDGNTDLATYQNGNFFISFGPSFNGANQVIPFAAPGLLNRPVAADMNRDGTTDLGLWIPYSGTGQGTAQWRFLMSNDPAGLAHAFSPTPLGADLQFQLGDPTALPLVGNFDPPVTAATGGGSTAKATPSASGAAAQLTTQRAWVASLYHDILGRAPDAPGWSYFTNMLVSGATPQQLTQVFLTSREYYGNVVDSFYARYLKRGADAPGRAAWVAALAQGASQDQVATDFVLSAEYAALHAGDRAFVDSLYADVLQRQADSPGEAAQLASLAAGTTRSQLVAIFMTSAERYHRVVDDLYRRILHRAADASGMQAYTSALGSGQLNKKSLEQALLNSNEYRRNLR